MQPVLLVATGNAKKGKEIRALLEGAITVETLADHRQIVMPPEVGDTFEANARAKAEFVCHALGVPVLADDSGLVVDALDGAPGVLSARYADGTDEDRYQKLLVAMADVADPARTARFVCAIAFAVPGGPTRLVEGRCEGRIARSPRGTNGFGYDPVFIVDGGAGPMAELTGEEKGAVSHRGGALKLIITDVRRHFSLELGPQNP